MNNLSLKQIKKLSNFSIYEKILINEELLNKDKVILYELIMLFSNSKDSYVKELGYRMLILYSLQEKDYKILYKYAINSEYYPLSHLLSKCFLIT